MVAQSHNCSVVQLAGSAAAKAPAPFRQWSRTLQGHAAWVIGSSLFRRVKSIAGGDAVSLMQIHKSAIVFSYGWASKQMRIGTIAALCNC